MTTYYVNPAYQQMVCRVYKPFLLKANPFLEGEIDGVPTDYLARMLQGQLVPQNLIVNQILPRILFLVEALDGCSQEEISSAYESFKSHKGNPVIWEYKENAAEALFRMAHQILHDKELLGQDKIDRLMDAVFLQSMPKDINAAQTLFDLSNTLTSFREDLIMQLRPEVPTPESDLAMYAIPIVNEFFSGNLGDYALMLFFAQMHPANTEQTQHHLELIERKLNCLTEMMVMSDKIKSKLAVSS